MTCLYLTPGVFDKGGISRYNRAQIQALRDILGADAVTVISLLGPSRTQNDMEHPFAVNWHGFNAISSQKSLADFSVRALMLGRRMNPSIIWSGHMNFSGLVWGLQRLNRAVSVIQVYGLEVWTQRRGRPDILFGFQRCDHVVADCHYTATYVRDHLRPNTQVPVMWDCVDTDKFTPGVPDISVLRRYGIPDPSVYFNIVTLGRLATDAAYKGYERLLEIFPRLPENTRLIFGGNGSLRPHLEEKASSMGVRHRIAFTGFIDEDDLPDVYRSAAVFSLIGDRGPGKGEGIPLTPLEAAACGVPILVGNQDGSLEAIIHGVNGYALDPFNLDGIAERIRFLVDNQDARLAMGHAARKRVEEEHAYPVFRRRMAEFLSEIEPRRSTCA